MKDELIQWLLQGDKSIQYQVYKDLLGQKRIDLQERIATEGWGKQFLDRRKSDGNWGNKFYHPKWISTHYTLLDLKILGISPQTAVIRESIRIILEREKAPDGGILGIGPDRKCDVCVNGMFLNYAAYFKAEERDLNSVIDYILNQRMADGGFNCQLNRSGAVHSSLHSTISLCEGINEYHKNGYTYRLDEILEAEKTSREFILLHQLFISDRTGEIITPRFLRFPFPSRWYYDILRALDYFQNSKTRWDARMKPAVDYLLSKRNRDGTWNLMASYPGIVHFEMEKAGKPSRWNTLRALRTLQFYNII